MLGLSIVVTSTTPLPGYGALLLMCGFSFGYFGFLVTYLAALTGGLLGFFLGRYLMRGVVTKMIQGNEKLQTVDQVISHGGYVKMYLLRIHGPWATHATT